MPGLSLTRLAREIAQSNRRVADSFEARGDASPAANSDAEQRKATRAARELTRFTLSRRHDLRAAWEDALEAFKDGLNADASAEVLSAVREVADAWLRLAERTRAFWGEVNAATGAAAEGLADLDTAEGDVKAVKAAVERMVAFLTKPRPLDLARLEAGMQEAAAGKFKPAGEIRASFGPKKVQTHVAPAP